MKLRHLMTAALGALLLSCQEPAAVLAQEAVGACPEDRADVNAPAEPAPEETPR